MKDKLIEMLRSVPVAGKTYEEYIEAIADMLIAEGYRKASDVAREIFEEIDDALHNMAMEYANANHKDYFAVCEMVHHKVIRPIEKKYTEEGK